MKPHIALGLSVLIVLLSACSSSKNEHTYRVGISQCSYDAWRINMDSEMERELIFHPDLVLLTRYADDNSELQCAQIDSFIAERVDLLIVSPNEAEEVRPAVSRAFDAGIPVIVADRHVSGEKYTAFIGGDNLEVGHIVGDYVLRSAEEMGKTAKNPLRVLEITGLAGSTPRVWRTRGMNERLRDADNVQIVAQATGRWFRADARVVVDSLLDIYPDIDLIVAQNDQMAIGAGEVLNKRRLSQEVRVIGVDAITGAGGGVEAILQGKINVSATYPSRGDLVIQTADLILHNNTYVRDTVLQSVLVDYDAAKALHQLAEMRTHEIAAITALQDKVRDFGYASRMQNNTILVLAVVVILLVLLVAVSYYTFRYRHRMQKQQMEQQRILLEQKHQLEQMTEQLKITQSSPSRDNQLLERLTDLIEKNMSNPDLSVEYLGEQLGVSRAQLFRRVKSLTGESPVELIRHIRLHRAQEMLRQSDESIQQIAYTVGFSSASYFTKCYKEMFHCSPQEERE